MRRYFIVLVFMVSCVFEPMQKCIKIVNDSDHPIYIAYSFTDSLQVENQLSLYEIEYFNNSKHYVNPAYRIEERQSGGIGISGRETLVSQAADKKLRLFIIKQEILKKYSWREICKNKMYDRKYIYSIDDLKDLNWEIHYSPVGRSEQ